MRVKKRMWISVAATFLVACADSVEPATPLVFTGSFAGTADVVDRGNTYVDQPFSAELVQNLAAVTGSVTVGLSRWNIRGTASPDSLSFQLELADPGGSTSPTYVMPTGYVYTGSARPGTPPSGGQVSTITGTFTGPDGFGGSTNVSFSATIQ